MEEELTCGRCSSYFHDAVTLPCSHSVCRACAVTSVFNGVEAKSRDRGDGWVLPAALPRQMQQNDRTDCASDDSGVGYLSMLELQSCLHQQIQGPINSLKCPRCSVSFILDERGVECLPNNLILEGLVQKYRTRSSQVDCQMCEVTPSLKATVTCEQCQVSYCDACLLVCHPKRGPLANHSLLSPNVENASASLLQNRGVLKCSEHEDETISMFCMLCKMPVCYLCFEAGRHQGHDAKALGIMYKEQKVEINRNLQIIQEKNNELRIFIEFLNSQTATVQENELEFEATLVAQIDQLIHLLSEKKRALIGQVSGHVTDKTKALQQQRDECMATSEKTVGLLQYTGEVLKEPDPARFLMISSSLCSRLAYTIETWIGRKGLRPVVEADVELEIEFVPIKRAIEECAFHENKLEQIVEGPPPPLISSSKCMVTNNTITLCWFMEEPETEVDNFVIEVDDGMGGEFQRVHSTTESCCTLGGLQFASTYRARICAASGTASGSTDDDAGAVGLPSDIIYLTTPQVSVFHFDTTSSHADITFSNGCQSITSSSFENRVALANVGFSRGRHYWEVTIDKYEGNPDPAMGVAHEDCTRDVILGKDDKAWSIYVDSSRSWFQHSNEHLFRSEGGIHRGSTIGLLLDLDGCSLTFYCDGERRGPVQFPSLQSVDMVYPAFSLNRNVALTLFTGLPPPDDVLESI